MVAGGPRRFARHPLSHGLAVVASVKLGGLGVGGRSSLYTSPPARGFLFSSALEG